MTCVTASVAMPMSGTFTIHLDRQEARPLGSPDHLQIQQSGTGTNQSPGQPLDGAAVGINEVATLKRGRGPVRGTITFTTPTGTTVSTYTGAVATDAQGRVTAQGRFRTKEAGGAFKGLRGSGTFSVMYTSKTDAVSQWSGTFTPPATMMSGR
ncbi:hypothetical protein [Methylobacterium sp. WSM2598]|uniref:hypothetical protein n=1 Tax=Methylobacterium sp. WSM2598 TaxID=398261 RepID=UPI001F256856|nr:hypothetical protein [Methylobacterium sp. WSM2598]